jgi:hypothetical protein
VRFETNGNSWSEDTRLSREVTEWRQAAIAASRKSLRVVWLYDLDDNAERF